jgi:hypothetical protein
MKDKIEKVLLSYDVEFSNDSTYSERGIRREDYAELAEELVKLFLIPPVISSVCDIHKGTRCDKSFPSYTDGKCRECGGQAN